MPGIVQAAVARRLRVRAAQGHFDGSPLASGLGRRLAGRDTSRSGGSTP